MNKNTIAIHKGTLRDEITGGVNTPIYTSSAYDYINKDVEEDVALWMFMTGTGFIRDYASKGYDLVICHSSLAKDAIMNTARDYPEIMFLWTDGDTVTDNIAVIVPMAQEAAYLAGILAAGMSKTGTVGIVGSIDIPSTHRVHEGFKLGVKAANPKVRRAIFNSVTGKNLPIWPCTGQGLPCGLRRRRPGELLPHHFTLT